MPAPPEKPAKPPEGLPDPELNPMTNPLLAKNMGRWAEVYYTSIPEKRDEAVQKLLKELREEEAGSATSPAAPPTSSAPKPLASATPERWPVCPACLHRNRDDDRFCGICGFPLQAGQAEMAKPTPPVPEQPITRTDDGWEWLRDKNLATLKTSTDTGAAWKYPVAIAVLAIALFTLYFVWVRKAPHGLSTAPAQARVSGAEQRPTQDNAAALRTTQPSEDNRKEDFSGVSTSVSQPDRAPQPKIEGESQDRPSEQLSPDAAAAGQEDSSDDGTQELLEGKRYLSGSGVPRSTRTASQWLWRAVAKQNTEAILLLSDLYVRGDGVPQSCDQARVLLAAAAKSGSAVATEKLASLRYSQCR